MDIREDINLRANEVFDRLEKYDRTHSHPNAVDNTFAATLGAIGLASEVVAARMATRPNTIPNTVGRIGLHGLALGAAWLMGGSQEHAVHKVQKH